MLFKFLTRSSEMKRAINCGSVLMFHSKCEPSCIISEMWCDVGWKLWISYSCFGYYFFNKHWPINQVFWNFTNVFNVRKLEFDSIFGQFDSAQLWQVNKETDRQMEHKTMFRFCRIQWWIVTASVRSVVDNYILTVTITYCNYLLTYVRLQVFCFWHSLRGLQLSEHCEKANRHSA